MSNLNNFHNPMHLHFIFSLIIGCNLPNLNQSIITTGCQHGFWFFFRFDGLTKSYTIYVTEMCHVLLSNDIVLELALKVGLKRCSVNLINIQFIISTISSNQTISFFRFRLVINIIIRPIYCINTSHMAPRNNAQIDKSWS